MYSGPLGPRPAEQRCPRYSRGGGGPAVQRPRGTAGGRQGSPRPRRRRPHLLLSPAPRCVVMHAVLTSPLSSLLRIFIYLFACLFIYYRPRRFAAGRAGPAPLGRLRVCPSPPGSRARGGGLGGKKSAGIGEGGEEVPANHFAPLPHAPRSRGWLRWRGKGWKGQKPPDRPARR